MHQALRFPLSPACELYTSSRLERAGQQSTGWLGLFSNRLETFRQVQRKKQRTHGMSMTRVRKIFAAALMFAGFAGTAEAKQFKVAMLNAGPDGAMVFAPAYLKIAPGDEVLFVAQDKAHNAQSIAGLTPAGGAEFKGALSQDLKVKFT